MIILNRLTKILIIIFAGVFVSQGSYLYSAYYNGPANEYFDGKRFKRIGIEESKRQKVSIITMILHFTGISKNKDFAWEPWDIKEEIPVSQSVPESKVIGDEVRYYFINHSTILIQTQGLNILTDPIYSDKAGFLWMGPKRVHKPGISFDNLPKIDLVLLSHSHYDHLDNYTMKKLFKRDNPMVITPQGNDYLLKKINSKFRVTPLLWDESTQFEGLHITLTKAYHWTRRGLFDENMALWGGFILETESGKKIYFSGDTAYGNENGAIFKEIKNKFGHLDLSFIAIGAYLPYDFMKNSHTSPEDSVRIHKLINSKKSIGIHFGTFQLSAEKYNQPQEDLEIAKKKLSLAKGDFITLKPGEMGSLK